MSHTESFSEVSDHIQWGRIDPARQMEALLALQSNPSLAMYENEFGESLLMVAAEAANQEVVHRLCLLGSNAKMLAPTGDTPLICVVRGAYDEAPETEVTEARAAIIDTLIRFGADPNQLAFQGCSALHYAVIYGLVPLVQQLLLGGADPMVRLCDPPSDESAIELAESGRFYGSDQQRQAIIGLLKHA